MMSISPSISVYQNIPGHFGGFKNLEYMLSIPSQHNFENDGFIMLLWELLNQYENEPDVLAKCIRFVANIACLNDRLAINKKHDIARRAVQAMQKFPLETCIQSKSLALFVNVHDIVDTYIADILDAGINAISKLPPNSYMSGKFVYVVENTIYSHAGIETVVEKWPQILPVLEKSKQFKILEPTILRCCDRMNAIL